MRYIQEAAADLLTGKNLQQNPIYHMPDQKDGVCVFLLSSSFEYDMELIKNMPPPRTNYKSIIIPSSVGGKIGPFSFKYQLSKQEYAKRLQYVQSMKMVPQLTVLKPPINKTSKENVYVSLTDVMRSISEQFHALSPEYIISNAPTMLTQLLTLFPNTQKKIFVIDSNRFKIYDGENQTAMKSDLINGLMAAYTDGKVPPSRADVTFVFRNGSNDYKMDLKAQCNIEKLHQMQESIGSPFKGNFAVTAAKSEDIDDMLASLKNDADDPELTDGHSINQTLTQLKRQLNVQSDGTATRDTEYDAKAFAINTALLHRITPDTGNVSNYKKLSDSMSDGGDHPVEDRIIGTAAQTLSEIRSTSAEDTTSKSVSSPRELVIRKGIGQIQLSALDIDKMQSVTDVPLPEPTRPLRITTTNPGAMKGSKFQSATREYEEKMMQQDIVASFMTLQKLPDGFNVTNVEVTDASTPLSMMNNWRVHLKNKRTGTQSHFDIYVPQVKNGSYVYNGTRYNIGKQDFPIPVMKINPKLVMLTSNYNKISVTRYDTKSLVDISAMLKAVKTADNSDGTNPYVKAGISTATNSTFISTIEYDEYARRWLYFENKQSGCRIVFNREACLKEFGFVNVQENEFCIGMVNKVPIVINTETGLDRHEKSITEIILDNLPDELRAVYNKTKPGKIFMYAEIKAGVKAPLGVAIAAWEGMTSLLERSGCQYKFISAREDAHGYLKIQFSDKTLAIQNTLLNQLIFNGFYRVNTKAYTFDQFDVPISNSNSVFIDIFNESFFKRYSQLTMFNTCYSFFVDAITEDVCRHYHIPSNLCDMLIYATKLLCDNSYVAETRSSLYRIRSSEIIPAIIHAELAREISRYNNNVGSKTKDVKFSINPMAVMNVLNKLETVSPLSALNPMVELHEKEIVSLKGFHGVNEDKAYSRTKRSYEDSMIGKIALSSPNNASVGINRQLTIDPKLESVRGYTIDDNPLDTDYNDLQLASFSEMFTPGTVSRDDAIRTAIATSQTSHIVSTADAEPVLVSNGLDEIMASYVSDEFAVVARNDGKVLEINDGYMIVQYKDNSKQAIPVSDRYSFNVGSGFFVDNKLRSNFEANDSFKKGDILAYHEKFFSKDSAGIVRANMGPLAKVALCGLYSTYEDAGLMTEKMSKRLATTIAMQQSHKLNATDDVEYMVTIGDEVEIGDPLIVFGLGDTGDAAVDNFLKAFQSSSKNILDSAKRTIKSKHAGRVVDVRMYTVKSLDRLSPSLFELFDKYFKENIRKRKILDKHDKSNNVYKMDTLYTLPTGPLKGPTIKGVTCDVLIEFYIAHDDEVSVGDKCVVYAASKQVISEVIPAGQEPYAESTPNEEISMFVAPSSILKRMIPSVVMTASANKVLVELKKKIREIWEK